MSLTITVLSFFSSDHRSMRSGHFSYRTTKLLDRQAETHLRQIFLSPKGPPFEFYDILQQTGFSKSLKGPPFTILKTLRFLSLRYSADFRRSRLVIAAEILVF